MDLVPCSSCACHVKSADSACPFCGAAVVPSVSNAAEARVRDRAALLFGAAAIAGTLAVAGCNNNATIDGASGGASGTPRNTIPTSDTTAVVMPYGVPIPHDVDAAAPEPRLKPAVPDAGSPDASAVKTPHATAVPAYGLPMPTSSQKPSRN